MLIPVSRSCGAGQRLRPMDLVTNLESLEVLATLLPLTENELARIAIGLGHACVAMLALQYDESAATPRHRLTRGPSNHIYQREIRWCLGQELQG